MYSRIPKCPEKNCPAHLGCGRCAPLAHGRSEEHTSELQSQSNLVCRLLLEKKKKNHQREVQQNPATHHDPGQGDVQRQPTQPPASTQPTAPYYNRRSPITPLERHASDSSVH